MLDCGGVRGGGDGCNGRGLRLSPYGFDGDGAGDPCDCGRVWAVGSSREDEGVSGRGRWWDGGGGGDGCRGDGDGGLWAWERYACGGGVADERRSSTGGGGGAGAGGRRWWFWRRKIVVSGTSGARTRTRTRTEAGRRSEWETVLYTKERCVRRDVGDWAGKFVVRSVGVVAVVVTVVVAVVVLPSVERGKVETCHCHDLLLFSGFKKKLSLITVPLTHTTITFVYDTASNAVIAL